MSENKQRVRFEIECGAHRETVEAPTPLIAWQKFVVGKSDLGNFVRFRERPWNRLYSWDTGRGGTRRGSWRYVGTQWFSDNETYTGTSQ